MVPCRLDFDLEPPGCFSIFLEGRWLSPGLILKNPHPSPSVRGEVVAQLLQACHRGGGRLCGTVHQRALGVYLAGALGKQLSKRAKGFGVFMLSEGF